MLTVLFLNTVILKLSIVLKCFIEWLSADLVDSKLEFDNNCSFLNNDVIPK